MQDASAEVVAWYERTITITQEAIADSRRILQDTEPLVGPSALDGSLVAKLDRKAPDEPHPKKDSQAGQ